MKHLLINYKFHITYRKTIFLFQIFWFSENLAETYEFIKKVDESVSHFETPCMPKTYDIIESDWSRWFNFSRPIKKIIPLPKPGNTSIILGYRETFFESIRITGKKIHTPV